MDVYGVSIEGRKIAAWIVSEPGQTFAVHVRDLARKSDATTRVYLDGVLGGSNTTQRPGQVLTRGTLRTGPTTTRPFQFSSIKTTDDENLVPPGQATAALGTIRIVVHRIVVVGRSVTNHARVFDPSHLSEITVHEKDKKLGGQSVALGPERTAATSFTRTKKRPYDPNDRMPWVEFEFRYRSREFLQAQGIIPLPHRSSPSDTEIQVVEASPPKKRKRGDAAKKAEIEALRKRLRQLESDEDVPEVNVKSESPARPSPFKKGEVIDLTLD